MVPIRKLNLKSVQVFVSVAEHRSFRAAAEQLRLSQSVISTQIKRLEEQLGVSLFLRTTRSVRLTAEGEQLLESAARAMQELKKGLQRVQESIDLRKGKLSIACSPSIAAFTLPHVLARFVKDYPGIELLVNELTATDLYEHVRSGKVDLGIGPFTDSIEFDCDTIYSGPLYAIVSKDLFRATGTNISLAQLASIPTLLMKPADAPLQQIINSAFKQRGLATSVRYRFSQTQSLITAAEAGLGAAILPRIAFNKIDYRGVQVLKIVTPAIIWRIAIVALRGRSLPPPARCLAELMRELIDFPASHRKKS